MTRLSPILETALSETGLPWALEPGHGHVKIRLAGRLAGVVPSGKNARDGHKRAALNVRAQIRKIAAEMEKAT